MNSGDILGHIFTYLSFRDQKALIACKRVCKQWHQKIESTKYYTSSKFLKLARNECYLEIQEIMNKHASPQDKEKMLKAIGESNNIKLIEYVTRFLLYNTYNKLIHYIFLGTAKGGNLALIRSIYMLTIQDTTTTVMIWNNIFQEAIGKSGSIEVFEWADNIIYGGENLGTFALRGAIKKGHVDLLKYLVAKKHVALTAGNPALPNMYKKVHYDLIKYLHPTIIPFHDMAAQYIISRCSTKHEGLQCKHKEVLQYYLDNNQGPRDIYLSWFYLFKGGCIGGNIDYLKMALVHEDPDARYTPHNHIYKEKNQKALLYLIENAPWTVVDEEIFNSITPEAIKHLWKLLSQENILKIVDEMLRKSNIAQEHNAKVKVLQYIKSQIKPDLFRERFVRCNNLNIKIAREFKDDIELLDYKSIKNNPELLIFTDHHTSSSLKSIDLLMDNYIKDKSPMEFFEIVNAAKTAEKEEYKLFSRLAQNI